MAHWYSVRAIQLIPTCEGLDGFQKSLCPCALDESSLSIGRVNSWNVHHHQLMTKMYYFRVKLGQKLATQYIFFR